MVSIFVGRLPEDRRQKARIAGLALALAARIVMIAVVVYLASLTRALVWDLSLRDMLLLTGGLFLLYKAVREIHHAVEQGEDQDESGPSGNAGYGVVIYLPMGFALGVELLQMRYEANRRRRMQQDAP